MLLPATGLLRDGPRQLVGEYVRPEDCVVFVIRDQAVLDEAYSRGSLIPEKLHLVSWEARRGSGVLDGDFIIHSRYCQHLEPLSLFFVLVGIAAGVGFIALLIRGDYYWDRFWEKNAEVPAEDLLRDREGRHREHEAERPEASTSGDEGSSSSGGAAC
ncbi:unnamed protein product [Prorocentrum cordatum]|uniref:Uncharacterized protein n=1 Tax=Prorocentrum cordatum TaxID=2364126 RepID=A0ABN9S889_9DINO|nr:unnamed protein product [Polarella glacialis]